MLLLAPTNSRYPPLRAHQHGRAASSCARPTVAGVAAPFFVSCSSTQPGPKASFRQQQAEPRLHRRRRHGLGGPAELPAAPSACRSWRSATWTPTTSTRPPKLCPAPALYADWRELLQKEGDRIDSVNVAVPDHTHFSDRLQRHSEGQTRLLPEAAVPRRRRGARAHRRRRSRRASSPSSARRSPRPSTTAPASSGCGKAGSARSPTPISARIGRARSKPTASKARVPPSARSRPPSLNWNLWLGTAPVRPYAPDIYHPTKWRAWQDFGTGWSGDIGCHIFDPVWKGLGLHAPLTVWAEVQESWKDSPARRADTWPQGDHIIWTFPGNDKIGGRRAGPGMVRRRILPARAHPQALFGGPEGIPARILDADRHRRLAAHPARRAAAVAAGGQVQQRPAAQAAAAQPLPPFRGRLPGRREDRVALRADRPDDRGHPARHRGHPGAGAEAGMGQPAPESHQLLRSQPLSSNANTARAGTWRSSDQNFRNHFRRYMP